MAQYENKSLEDALVDVYVKYGRPTEGYEASARCFLQRKIEGVEIGAIRLQRVAGRIVCICYDPWGRRQEMQLPASFEGEDIDRVAEALAKAAKGLGRKIETYSRPFADQIDLGFKRS